MVLRIAFGLAALTVVALSAACSSETTSPTREGTPAASTSGTTPDEENPPATDTVVAYTEKEVQALFDARCVKCHDARSANLDLSAPFTASTVGMKTGGSRSTMCSQTGSIMTRIKPGDREGSLLWHKVKGTQDCGSPMPYDRGNKKLDATELERLGLYIDSLK
jgi:hypothetical protein